MQKKIIALAVAGLASTAAFAQTNVTMYGIVDVGYGYSNLNGNTATTVNHNSSSSSQILSGGLAISRIGFKGVEDLGNGLKALFVLEYALNADQVGSGGALGGSARQQFVGLTGGFGTVIAGGLQTTAKGLVDKYDPMGSSMFSPLRNLQDAAGAINMAQGTGSFYVNTINSSARLSNAVAYVAPTFFGLTASTYYSLGGVSGDNINTANSDQEKIFGATLEYANGPVGVAAIFHNTKDFGNPPGNQPGVSAKEFGLFSSVDLKVLSLFLNGQLSDVNGVGNKRVDKMWSTGVKVPFGKNTVSVAYARSYSGQNTSAMVGASDSIASYGIQYTYDLSKRTTAYAGLNRVVNSDQTALGNIVGLAPSSLGNNNANSYGFGLKHTF